MAKGRGAREHIWLECTECHQKNYRTEKNLKALGASTKLNLMKYCPWERKHTLHTENRKK